MSDFDKTWAKMAICFSTFVITIVVGFYLK